MFFFSPLSWNVTTMDPCRYLFIQSAGYVGRPQLTPVHFGGVSSQVLTSVSLIFFSCDYVDVGSWPGIVTFFPSFQFFISCSVCPAVTCAIVISRACIWHIFLWMLYVYGLLFFQPGSAGVSCWKYWFCQVFFFSRNSLFSPRCFWFLSFLLEAVLGCLRILDRALELRGRCGRWGRGWAM